MAAFTLDRMLKAKDRAFLVKLSRRPGVQGTDMIQWLKKRGYAFNSSAVYRWRKSIAPPKQFDPDELYRKLVSLNVMIDRIEKSLARLNRLAFLQTIKPIVNKPEKLGRKLGLQTVGVGD